MQRTTQSISSPKRARHTTLLTALRRKWTFSSSANQILIKSQVSVINRHLFFSRLTEHNLNFCDKNSDYVAYYKFVLSDINSVT